MDREMPQGEADKNLKDFLARKVDVLVSTNLASRGIDFVEVKHVVQFQFAQSLVDHIHRVGRCSSCSLLPLSFFPLLFSTLSANLLASYSILYAGRDGLAGVARVSLLLPLSQHHNTHG